MLQIGTSGRLKGREIYAHLLVWVSLACLTFVLPPFMWVATASYYLMVSGVIYRWQRRRHVTLMATSIAIDLSVVLVLEFQRSAINAAINHTYTFFQTAHILTASLAVAFYFPTVFFGLRRILKPNGPLSDRHWHIRMAVTAFILRSLGFLFMFSMFDIKR